MTRARLSGVPIVDYHRLVAPGVSLAHEDPFAVTESSFRDQLQMVRELGYTVVPPEDVAAGRAPESSVVFTFDDGYSSHYEVAFPVLAEFGVSGTFFVNTSSLGTGEFLDWAMAAEMTRGGMRFGSHAHTHIVLTTLPQGRLREELKTSREMLEQRLSCAVEVLAVPYGFCDHKVLSAAWESGYRVVCNSRPWPARPGANVLSRTGIVRRTALEEFRALLQNHPPTYLRLWARDRALAIPRYVFVRLRPELLGVRTAEGRL